MARVPFLAGWALFVEAFMAMRRKEYADAHRLLDEAGRQSPPDPMRAGAVLHVRGTLRFHEGDPQGALALLLSRRFGPLFATQFLSAFNDNALRNALVLMIAYRTHSADALSAINTLRGMAILA